MEFLFLNPLCSPLTVTHPSLHYTNSIHKIINTLLKL